MSDPHRLQRFVDAQNPLSETVVAELIEGHKRSHWMWFFFPQLRGLGSSPKSQYYGITGLDEARAYLRHPVLGPRLRACTRLTIGHTAASAVDLFGTIDMWKFQSCMTLFEQAAPTDPLFPLALTQFYGGERDARTLDMLQALAAP